MIISDNARKGPDQVNFIYICTWCEKLFSLHFSSNPLLWGLPLLLNLILRTISSLPHSTTIWSGCWVRCLQIHRNCNLSCFQEEDETDQMSHALLETTTIDWKTTPCKIGCGSSFHYLRRSYCGENYFADELRSRHTKVCCVAVRRITASELLNYIFLFCMITRWLWMRVPPLPSPPLRLKLPAAALPFCWLRAHVVWLL